ncbi:hypothetical protein KZZ52_41505 [Dactylosporangium sp. AC04546]|uniref:hypothetical protein n=1 Tax=Dactylosporangium sp. AC04546 TaxID=2862460 RepID=UPI001EDD0772|nr:hypothetical protein [Dactylosporangium sp. AC04546]WVK80404.1 hypothetical protein KZZ52_41505 [Dactylosporangium sp. AC04546]
MPDRLFAFPVLDSRSVSMNVRRDPIGDHPPTCTVRFDEGAGCGVNLELVGRRGTSFVGVTFVTRRGAEDPHDLTFAQVEQLQAALAALTNRRAPSMD